MPITDTNLNIPNLASYIAGCHVSVSGTVEALLYQTAGGAYTVFFRDTSNGNTSTATLDSSLANTSQIWATAYDGSQFSLLGQAGVSNQDVVFFRHTLSGSPLPTSATLVETSTLSVHATGVASPSDLLECADGSFVAVWKYSSSSSTMQVSYRSTSGTWSEQDINYFDGSSPAVSGYVKACQRTDNSAVWLAGGFDGRNHADAWRFTENGSALTQTYHGTVFDDPSATLPAGESKGTSITEFSLCYGGGYQYLAWPANPEVATNGIEEVVGQTLGVARIDDSGTVTYQSLSLAGVLGVVSYSPVCIAYDTRSNTLGATFTRWSGSGVNDFSSNHDYSNEKQMTLAQRVSGTWSNTDPSQMLRLYNWALTSRADRLTVFAIMADTNIHRYEVTSGPAFAAATPTSPATVGTPYSYQFVATGTDGPITYALASGSLPLGIVLRNTGWITGTPMTAGTYNFAVSATDTNGTNTTSTVTVIVNAAATTVFPGGFTGEVENWFWHWWRRR